MSALRLKREKYLQALDAYHQGVKNSHALAVSALAGAFSDK